MWRSEVCPRAALRNAARARYPVASIRTQRFSTPDGVFAQRWPQGCKAAASVQRAGFPGARSRFVVGRTREALSCVQWCGQARRNMQLRAIPPVFPRCEFWRPGANPVHKPVGWFHSEGGRAGRGTLLGCGRCSLAELGVSLLDQGVDLELNLLRCDLSATCAF